jgi:hypothetical protein
MVRAVRLERRRAVAGQDILLPLMRPSQPENSAEDEGRGRLTTDDGLQRLPLQHEDGDGWCRHASLWLETGRQKASCYWLLRQRVQT